MPISPIELSKKSGMERVVVYIKDFKLLEDAPPELELMYKPVIGEIYKALFDVKAGVYYLDIPETLERDSGGWAFTGLKQVAIDENIIDYEFIVIDKDNAISLDLDPDRIIQLADWLDEDTLKFSWEDDDKKETALTPRTKDEWEEMLHGEDHVDGINSALDVIYNTNPKVYSALSLVIIMTALQEQGLLPQLNNDQLLYSKANPFGAASAISALLNSHINRATVPNMVGITRISLLEIASLIEGGMEEFFEKLKKK